MVDFKKFFVILFICSTISFVYYILTKSEVGITKDEILIGQSCALSGPASSLGIDMRDGALAYFSHINHNGGIAGKKIRLITYDDKYEPKLALENSKKLIEQDRVFALFGEVGTPTSIAVLPYITHHRVPFLTPFSGANELREPFNRYIINFRDSYESESEKLVAYLVDKKGYKKISIFYQNDSYGESGLNGAIKALQKRDIKLLSKGVYKRNTLSITNALYKIVPTKPEAIIIIGAYKQSALFIKRAKEMGLSSTIYANISFVGSKALIHRLQNDTKNVIISQVVPLPNDTTNQSVKEYQEIYSKYYPNKEYDFVSLEGFLSAKLVVEGLKKSASRITRSRFISAIESVEANKFENIEISLSKENHQAMNKVYLSIYEKNSFRLINEKD
jgi:ABC-type branched-subunit amino acid transport system substrate-binding protein